MREESGRMGRMETFSCIKYQLQRLDDFSTQFLPTDAAAAIDLNRCHYLQVNAGDMSQQDQCESVSCQLHTADVQLNAVQCDFKQDFKAWIKLYSFILNENVAKEMWQKQDEDVTIIID